MKRDVLMSYDTLGITIDFRYSIFTLVNVYVDLVVFNVLPVLHIREVVDIGVNTKKITCQMPKGQ